jgi:hypothetical protein
MGSNIVARDTMPIGKYPSEFQPNERIPQPTDDPERQSVLDVIFEVTGRRLSWVKAMRMYPVVKPAGDLLVTRLPPS